MLDFGLGDFIGAEVPVLIAALTNALAPAAGRDEDDVARRAMASTMAQILESELVEETAFASLDADTAREVFGTYVVEYINARLMQVLGSRVESRAEDERELIQQEREIKDFVARRVEVLMDGKAVLGIDWNGREGAELVEAVFVEAYELLEVDQ